MRIRMTTGMRYGFSPYNSNDRPLTIISGHYPSKPKRQKTKEEIERDSWLDKTHQD